MTTRLPALAVCAGLSAAFVLVALSNPARAFTDEQQQACAPDALKLCSDTIPDIPKTTACMRSHLPELSPACKTAFVAATGGAAGRRGSQVASRPPGPASARVTRGRVVASQDGSIPRRESVAPLGVAPPAQRAGSLGTAPNPAGTVYPPYPSVAGLAAPPADSLSDLGSTARLCREGLIDRYTCTVTAPALGLIH